jgi:peptidoglycan/xylan/chitin deacetylase (PgdA/CDA1 family)
MKIASKSPENGAPSMEDPGRPDSAGPASPASRLRSAFSGALSLCRSELGYRSGLYRLAARAYAGLGIVFMLHRVAQPGQPILSPGYTVSLDVLEDTLQTVERLGWEMVDLDEAARRLAEPRTGRRFACFTFDDGYLDNLELALPLFRKYNVPFAVSLTIAALDRTLFYWWGGLEELVLNQPLIDVPATDGLAAMKLSTRNFAEKQAACAMLDTTSHRMGDRFFSVLGELFDRYQVDLRRLVERDTLSVEQARTLAADPLVTIASHCLTHSRLADLSETEVRREFTESRRLLEDWTGKPVHHLVYPYGSRAACGRREFALAREAGYKTAFTTRRGNIFAEHRDRTFSLPRRNIPLSRVECREKLFGIEALRLGQPRIQIE